MMSCPKFCHIDLQVVVIQALENCVQLLKMIFEGAIGDKSDVVDETDYILHVSEERGHFFLVNVGADGETHC